jgi:hypothetical protein
MEVTRQALIALPAGNLTEPKIPSGGKELIARMKAQIAMLVDAYMNCAPADHDATAIQAELSPLVHAFTFPDDATRDVNHLPPTYGHYGSEVEVTTQQWADHPGIVGIVVAFAVECAQDKVLFIFAANDGAWHELIRWQNKPYDGIGGSLNDVTYALSPNDEANNWYVFVKSIAPGCGSACSTISYTVLRPSPSPSAPRIAYRGEDPIWWGGDDSGEFTLQKYAFEIRFHAMSIDTGVHNRVWIRHFLIDGDRAKRIPPYALSQPDFVDEWIVSSWKEARGWSVPSARNELARMHGVIRTVYKKTDLEYDTAYACSGAEARYQISILADAETPQEKPYYFIVEGDPDYRMVSVSDKPDPTCDGDDILWKKWPLPGPAN